MRKRIARDVVAENLKDWREYVGMLEKRTECKHVILWDATGEVGICVKCGLSVKKVRP
jgi:hypothetical protein